MNQKIKALLLGGSALLLSLVASPDISAGGQYVRKGKGISPSAPGKCFKSKLAMMNRKSGESKLFMRSGREKVVAPSTRRLTKRSAAIAQSVYTGIVYGSGNFQLGYGLLNPTNGAWIPKVEDGISVQSIGYSEERNEVYTLTYNVYEEGYGEISSNVYDFSSGEKKNSRIITTSEEFENFPIYGAYLPEENAFYGYGNAGWVKWDMASLTGSVIKSYTVQEGEKNLTPSLCYDYNRDSFVGIVFDNKGAELVLVNKSTGHSSTLSSLPVPSAYVGGMCYDSASGQYIWNPNDDNTSEIVAIDATSFDVTDLCTLNSIVETGCMFLPPVETPAGPDAPKSPEFTGSSFPAGAFTGKVFFRLPSTLNNGTAITGDVNYTVTVNGNTIASGRGIAGSEICVDVDESAGLAQGYATFRITAEKGGKTSDTCKGKVWIGYDTPMSPTNVKLTPSQVTWDAVTEGVHGGYVDPSDIYYTVSLNGEVVADFVTGTTSISGLTLSSPLDTYQATVTATCHGLTSLPGKSNDITYGEPKGEPYHIEPTLEEFEKCVIFNVNGDTDFSGAEQTWRFDEWSGYGNAFSCNDDWQTVSDDWIFLPPVNIKNTANLHRFTMQAWCGGGASSPDKLEVCLCKTPSPDSPDKIWIMQDLNIVHDGYQPGEYSKLFNITHPGNYYIGIHNITPNGWYTVDVNNIRLDVTDLDNNSSGAVTDLCATAAENGGLNATINFRMPTTSIGGFDLRGDLTATIVSPAETISVSGAPGSEQSVVIRTLQSTETEQNLITVTTSADGKEGDTASIKVYTGVVVAGPPTDIRMEFDKDNMGGVLKWNAPASALNVSEGYIGETFEYTVCRLLPGYIEQVWEPIENIGNATEYRIKLPEGTSQSVYGYGVIASNAAGCGGKMILNNKYYSRDERAMAGRNFVLGKLYKLPAIEEITPDNVSSNTLPYGPMTFNKISGGGYFDTPVLIDNASSPLDSYSSPTGAAMLLRWWPGRGSGSARGEVALPKFSLKGKDKVAFTPNFYLPTIDNLEIGIMAYGQDEVEIIADFSSIIGAQTSGWNDMQVTLPEKYNDAQWVQIFLYPTFKTYEHMLFFLNGFKLMNMVAYDLEAVSIDAPAEAEQGSTFRIEASARNYGNQEIRSYTARLFADGTEIASTTGSNVKSLATTEAKFECTMNPLATENVEYSVTFECEGDADNANDSTAHAIVTPTASRMPKVSDLQASLNEDGVVLTWQKPGETSIPGEPETDDFEDAESFANHYGDWIFIDEDDAVLGGIDDVSIPNITPGETKASFMIWDNNVLGGHGTDSHSGTKSLFAFFREDEGVSDDWAVSPELSGDAQTVSFYARSYHNSYPHQIEVWYSDGSVKPADFTQAELTGSPSVSAEWTLLKATLPEGAKRFAIRNITNGGFIVFVDDVTYIPAGTPRVDINLKGYDVYRDGNKLTTAPIATTAFEDTEVTDGETYTYMVTAVYDKGISSPCDPATIKFSGTDMTYVSRSITSGHGYIRITGYDGEDITVSSPDGKIIATGNAGAISTINVDSGIYVVKAGRKTAKIIVK